MCIKHKENIKINWQGNKFWLKLWKEYNINKTIVEDLKDYIDEIEDEINRGGYTTLTFEIQDNRGISHKILIKGRRKEKE